MATKLFLKKAQSYVNGYYDMSITADTDGNTTAVVTTTASGTQIQWTKTAGGATMAWISGRVPSGGFTLTTTDASIWVIESAAGVNAGGRYRVFKYSGGSETEIGGGPFDDGVEFSSMSTTEMTWTGNVTDTAFAENDRIVVKFYATNSGTMGAGTATLTYGAIDGSTGDSFFNINETVTFKTQEYPDTVLNTTDATDFGSDTTPTLEFTGTDPGGNDVEYQVHIDTVNTFDSQSSTNATLDSYSESNQDTDAVQSGAGVGIAQSFMNVTEATLKSCKFYIKKTGTPTGNINATIRTHTGTFGTSGVPDGGVALATSDNFDSSTLTTSYQLITFTFSGAEQITLSADTPYFVALLTSFIGPGSNISLGVDNSSPTHAGNRADLAFATWGVFAGSDVCFYVVGDTAAPLLSKLSASDSGFVNTVSGGDTTPFNSGEKTSFTVQAGDALSTNTYHWRARSRDVNNSNTYSSWATTRTFSINTGGGATSPGWPGFF